VREPPISPRPFLQGAFSAVATVLLLEGLARVFAPAPLLPLFPEVLTVGRPLVRSDPDVGFTVVPGFSGVRYRVNEAGFRGEELPADIGERAVVLCVGDSTTFGWGVLEGDDFPAQLARALDARASGTTWVVNGGVPSFSSTQVVQKLVRDLGRVRPRIVVLTMPWNDVWYSALASWRPEALVPHLPGPFLMWLMRRSALVRAFGPRRPVPSINRSVPEALDLFAENIGHAIEVVRGSGAAVVLQVAPFDLDHVDPGGIRHDPSGLLWDADFLIGTARRYTARFEQVARAHRASLVQNPLSMGNSKNLFLDHLHPNAAGYALMAGAVLHTLEAEGLVRY
jgi:lysophospholipase L1-like esterase